MATEGDIREAQRKAVGGKRKRCRKGKSCSATCISGIKECLVQMSSGISGSLEKLVGAVSGRTRREGKEKYERIKGRLLKGIEKSARQGTFAGDNLERRLLRLERIGKRLLVKKDAQDQAVERTLRGRDRRNRYLDIKIEAYKRMVEYFDNNDMGNYYRMKEVFSNLQSKAGPRFGDTSILTNGLDHRLTGEKIEEIGRARLGGLARKVNHYYKVLDRLDKKMLPFETSEKTLSEKDAKILGRLTSGYSAAKYKINQVFASLRAELLETNLPESRINQIMSGINKKNLTEEDSKTVREFIQMFNGGGVSRREFDSYYLGKPVGTIERDVATTRANAGLDGVLHLSPNSSRGVLFHELGHFLEYSSHTIRRHAEDWRNSRGITRQEDEAIKRSVKDDGKERLPIKWVNSPGTGNKEIGIAKLKDLTASDYEDDEVAVVPKVGAAFIHPYMGKVYEGGYASEVISMAVENMTDNFGMATLHRQHSDLFSFIVGLTQIR